MNIMVKKSISAKSLTKVPMERGKFNPFNMDEHTFSVPYVVSKVNTPGMPRALCPVQADLPVLRGEKISAFAFFRLADERGSIVRGIYVLTAYKFDVQKRAYVPVATVYADKKTAERLYRFINSKWDFDYAEGTLSIRGAEAIYKETAEKVLTGIFE